MANRNVGTFSLESYNHRFLQLMEAEKKKILEKIGEFVEGEAKDFCPVDTGDLRRSIKNVVVSDKEVQIGTDIDYAHFVEFGTIKQQAQPYLTPAFEANRNEIRRILEEGIRRAIQNGGTT